MIGEYKNLLFGYMLLLCLGIHGVSFVFGNKAQNGLPSDFMMGPGPVILVTPSEPTKSANVDCGDVPIDECLKKLQTFLKLPSLPFPSMQSELDKLCNDAISGYNCSVPRISAPNCATSEEKGLLTVFVSMAEYTVFMFCDGVPGSQAYLKDTLLDSSECILKYKSALDCCAKQSKLPDIPIMYLLDQSSKSVTDRQISTCCPVSNYIRCVKDVVHSKCGEAASNLTTEYIRRASGEQMESVCLKVQGYPDHPNPEVCKHAPPVCAGCRTVSIFVELLAVMSVMSLVYFVAWEKHL